MHPISFILFAALVAESYAGVIQSRPSQSASVASTQYHATCAAYSTSIQTQIKNKKLALRTGRRWPDEFAWSGGFYLTPNQNNALAYAAVYLSECASHGGIVIMQFTLALSTISVIPPGKSKLNVNSLGTTGNAPQEFWEAQYDLGFHIKTYADKNPGDFPKVPIQDGVADNNGDTTTTTVPPPTTVQMNNIKKVTSNGQVSNDDWQAYANFIPYDIITGAIPLTSDEVKTQATAKSFGLPLFAPPFIQVVLVTDKAMGALKYVSQTPFDKEMAANQLRMMESYQ
ncbi:hypothetical protein C8R47DRAFT_611625 [Mycena vitilis]|nr:hypothetical protein C8R47DRAFT_611625 [Mycena vitilis]